ncbi:tripartite tricarboxylate transporter permease [Oceaniglobus trochenteri]|uniref:tripartite tricarboxylate transporter permease n=1 Tax=Oceaniglobus trochenteri TaxID=2763260 RepID=UPI001D000980
MDQIIFGGFDVFASWGAVLAVAVGTALGLVIGVLPGLGPLMGIVLLLPIAFQLPPIVGMGLLISIYVGGACGGAISAILVRIPGTPMAAATLLDGYPMARAGRAHTAMSIAVSASAVGGLIGGVILVFLAPALAQFALRFGPAEYFALTVVGLITIALVGGENKINGLISGVIGLLLATVGYDQFVSEPRFTGGSIYLLNGFNVVALVVGLFAISEVIFQVMGGELSAKPKIPASRPSFSSSLIALKYPMNLFRSSSIGAGLGALPGTGGPIASFSAYAITRSLSKNPERFGTGVEDGIVSTESANNAAVGGALVPTLALGVPGDPVVAVLMGALVILGFFPGPSLFEHNQEFVGGIFYSYIASNFMLFFLGIVMTPIFVACIRLRKVTLLPLIVLLCMLGVYSLESSIFDLWVMLVFGGVGFGLRAAGFPLAPLIVGFILGPILESNFRRALVISGDDYWIFVESTLAFSLLSVAALAFILVIFGKTVKQLLIRLIRPS